MIRDKNEKWKKAAYFLSAIFAGAANGLFGGGGGLTVVPCLRAFGGLDEREAHATSVAVVAPLSFLSFLVYTAKGISDFSLAWQVGTGVLFGGTIGALLLRKVPKPLLTFLFNAVMIYAGIKFLV